MENNDFLIQPPTGHLTMKMLKEIFEKISSEPYKIRNDKIYKLITFKMLRKIRMKNHVKMKCMICDAKLYYSPEEIEEEFPSHCGKIRMLLDFSDFEISLNRWLAIDSSFAVSPPDETY